MTDSITLPFWPSSIDCVKWSTFDNRIAVAGGERIAVLTSRYKDRAPNGTYWDIDTFLACAFTADELLRPGLFSARNLSIGEELSNWHVQSIAWSLPGLGRRGQCLLAVLSSNHVLCLWALGTDPDLPKEWKRTLIVNDPLKDYQYSHERKAPEQSRGDGDGSNAREWSRVRQRIRAFAWSDALPQRDANGESLQFLNRRLQFLATLTETGEIVILQVDTPYDRAAKYSQRDWSARVSAVTDVYPREYADNNGHNFTAINSESDHSRTSAKHKPVALSIALSDWTSHRGHDPTCTVCCIFDGRLVLKTLRASWTAGKLQLDFVEPLASPIPFVNCSDLRGPLSIVGSAGNPVVVTYGDNVIHHLTNDGDATHHLDGRWDEISATAIIQHDGDVQSILSFSLLSSLSTPSTAITPSLTNHTLATTVQDCQWRAGVIEAKAAYSREYNLGGKVSERIWGAASSPLQRQLAVCASSHPSSHPLYVIMGHRSCALIITYETDIEKSWLAPRPVGSKAVTADVILPSLQHYLRQKLRLDAEMQTLRPSLIEQMWLNTAPPDGYDQDPALHVSVLQEQDLQIMTRLKAAAFSGAEAARERVTRLVDIALSEGKSTVQLSWSTVRSLVEETLDITRELSRVDNVSMRVIAIYRTVLAKLDPNFTIEDEDWQEQCSVCGEDIPFESLRWGRCVAGHQFARCALSFLSIREPGATKTCGICGLLYLDELVAKELAAIVGHSTKGVAQDSANEGALDLPRDAASEAALEVPAEALDEMQLDNDEVPILPVARLLFDTFDVCLYCGGRFLI